MSPREYGSVKRSVASTTPVRADLPFPVNGRQGSDERLDRAHAAIARELGLLRHIAGAAGSLPAHARSPELERALRRWWHLDQPRAMRDAHWAVLDAQRQTAHARRACPHGVAPQADGGGIDCEPCLVAWREASRPPRRPEGRLQPVHAAPLASFGGGPKPLPPHEPKTCEECASWVEKGWAGTPMEHAKWNRAARLEAVGFVIILAFLAVGYGIALGLLMAEVTR